LLIKYFKTTPISHIVELLHQIVELLQKLTNCFKSFREDIIDSIFAEQSLNHKILLTIKIYKSWQQIQEES
jgi:hypothetical protein